MAQGVGRTREVEAERRRKIAEAKRGKPLSAEHRAKLRKPRSVDVGYVQVHRRVTRLLPKTCLYCGDTSGAKRLEVALIHGRGTRQNSKGHWYSLNVEDYVRLCGRCHKRYDLGLLEVAV